MNNLPKYIVELLLRHDCVIIPGFGAFIANYQPSKIVDGKIYPPSRNVVFNPSLVSNDGLLFHFLAEKNKMSYEEASATGRRMIQEWQEVLQKGETISINKLGELQQTEHAKIIFSPYYSFNFLTESYGLEAIGVKEVNRSRLIPEAIDLKPKPRVRRGRVKSGNRKVLYYSLAFYFPVLVILWGMFLLKEPFTGEMASFVPTGNEIQQGKTMVEKQQLVTPVIQEPEIKPDATSKQKAENIPDEPFIPHYFIICGCFKEMQNAEKYKADLIQRGFSDTEIIADGVYQRVSLKSFSVADSAQMFINELKGKENLSVWILNK